MRAIDLVLIGGIGRQNTNLFGGITILYAVVLVLGFVISDVRVDLLEPGVRYDAGTSG